MTSEAAIKRFFHVYGAFTTPILLTPIAFVEDWYLSNGEAVAIFAITILVGCYGLHRQQKVKA